MGARARKDGGQCPESELLHAASKQAAQAGRPGEGSGTASQGAFRCRCGSRPRSLPALLPPRGAPPVRRRAAAGPASAVCLASQQGERRGSISLAQDPPQHVVGEASRLLAAQPAARTAQVHDAASRPRGPDWPCCRLAGLPAPLALCLCTPLPAHGRPLTSAPPSWRRHCRRQTSRPCRGWWRLAPSCRRGAEGVRGGEGVEEARRKEEKTRGPASSMASRARPAKRAADEAETPPRASRRPAGRAESSRRARHAPLTAAPQAASSQLTSLAR